MKKRIRIKKERKSNKLKINNILKDLKFNVTKKVFGNGYFIFSFKENSVCWFWLKEFPGWKFGIWLNENNTFSIFGEHILMIDKFKPSASYISFKNVEEFNNELILVLNKDEKHEEYLKDIKETIEFDNKKHKYIFNYIKDFNNFIKEFNKKHNRNIELELKDFGGCRSPRFEFYLSYESKKYFLTKEEELELCLELSKIKEKNYNIEYAEEYMEESFLVEFGHIRQTVYSNKEFEYNKNKYNWENNSLEEFYLN